VRREWQPEELIASWTLVDRDWVLVANKTGATRLGFALLLKFFELEGRFPTHAAELPPAAVEYVAGLVKVAASESRAVRVVGSHDRVSPRADPGGVRVSGADARG
jgi:hypothetical protein